MRLAIFILLFIPIQLFGTDYYLSTTGSDATGDGSIGNPWFSLNKAWSVLTASDDIYMRGGTYTYTVDQLLQTGVSGTSSNYIKVWAYGSESPVITDGASLTPANYFIFFAYSDYVHWKGIEVSNVTIAESFYCWAVGHCIFEQMDISYNIQGFILNDESDGNLIYNCDFHHNQDPLSDPPYEHADGVSISWNTSSVSNTIRGCRIYWNSDDGLDMWQNDGHVLIDSCWTWYNGYVPDTFDEAGNGDGLKFGITGEAHDNSILITVQNCIGAGNKQFGFAQNGAQAAIALYNNIAYDNNSQGFNMSIYNEYHVIRNNISYGNSSNATILSNSTVSNNTFLIDGSDNPSFTVTDGDFVSIDISELLGNRKANGCLPDIDFGHLAEGSDLIDAGIYVGLDFQGTAPDIGAFEFSDPPVIPSGVTLKKSGTRLMKNNGKLIR